MGLANGFEIEKAEPVQRTAKSSAIFCSKRRIVWTVLFILLLVLFTLILCVIGFVHHATKNRPRMDENETGHENVTTWNLGMWEAPEEIQNMFTYYLAGYDHQNTPVWIVPFGKYKTADYLEEAGEEGEKLLEKYTDQFYYRIQESRFQRPRPKIPPTKNTTFVIICDFQDYSYAQFSTIAATKFILRLASKFSEPVSEIEYGFVLNLDWLSRLLIGMTRPILGAAMAKMEMFGEERDEYIQKLAEKIPASQLPAMYGGDNTNYKPVASYG